MKVEMEMEMEIRGKNGRCQFSHVTCVVWWAMLQLSDFVFASIAICMVVCEGAQLSITRVSR